MSYFVYILFSESTNKFYKGHTKDIDARMFRHNNNYEKSTRNGAPWKLIWIIPKPDKSSAAILEKKLKNLSRINLIDFIKRNPEGLFSQLDTILNLVI